MGLSYDSMRKLVTREKILDDLLLILKDMTADWDMDFSSELGPETKLVSDLNFESIDIVQLIVAIEEHFQLRGLPWEEFLMSGGRYKDEVTVQGTVSFLHEHLNQ